MNLDGYVELLLQFALNFGTDLTLAAGFGDGEFTVRPPLGLIARVCGRLVRSQSLDLISFYRAERGRGTTASL